MSSPIRSSLARLDESLQTLKSQLDCMQASLEISDTQLGTALADATQSAAIVRDLIAHPTVFVSSEQATITLARYLALKKPAEAKKLLDPLRSQPGAVGQVALTMLGEMAN